MSEKTEATHDLLIEIIYTSKTIEEAKSAFSPRCLKYTTKGGNSQGDIYERLKEIFERLGFYIRFDRRSKEGAELRVKTYERLDRYEIEVEGYTNPLPIYKIKIA